MYNKLKNIFKKFIPTKLLIHYESFFRFFLYQFYRGRKYQCNICGKGLRKFIPFKDEEKLCPNCGSASRHRRLWNILNSEFLKGKPSILDFSPHRSLYRQFKKIPSLSYTSTDLSGFFLADQHYDITNIPIPNDTDDLIICYHVLEHVENDRQALKELYRVLKPGGVCLIQTPFKQGEIVEDFSITTDEGRLKHFGQWDHVRVYSAAGLKERLEKCGFQVETREYHEKDDNPLGYKRNELIILCRK